MVIRFLFLTSLVLFGFFVNQPKLFADTNCSTDEGKQAALDSGDFAGCGKTQEGTGQEAIIAEFGTPQKLVDEDNPDSGLTPIEMTEYDNPDKLSFYSLSNVKFHFYKFLNNAEIDVKDNSAVDLQLYQSNVDLKFTNNANDRSVITYRGGTTGKISVYLNTVCTNGSCFNTNSNINHLDFQGEITYNPDGSINTVLNGGMITIGVRNSTTNEEEPANVVIDYIKGNGTIELTDESKLTIKNYEYDDINSNLGIFSVRGGYDSEVIFDTKIFIRSLAVENATFNYYSKISTISADTNKGKHIFNANSDIGNADKVNNMVINKNSHVIVESLNSINETSISKGSTLEFLGVDSNTTENIITKVQGQGTLLINPENWVSGTNADFKITNINLNTLLMNDGDLRITNDSATFTNETYDKNGDLTFSEKKEQRIKYIGRSDDKAKGGSIIIAGSVVFDNIDYLNKLSLCAVDPADSCKTNANLTLKKVNHLNELEMNGGNLYLEIGNNSNIANANHSAALSVDTLTLNGGKILSVLRDTTTIKNSNTYFVLNSKNVVLGQDIDPHSIFDTKLPDWYDWSYNLYDMNNIMLEVNRLTKYNEVVSKNSNDADTLKLASYFDSLIDSQTPLDISARTLTFLDILSNEDNLANNIQSLIPLSKNTYIKTSNNNLRGALDVSKSKGIVNKYPFGVWDKRQGSPTPKDSLWVVYASADGKFDTNYSLDDSYNSMSMQFGYSLYNWVSPNNAEGQTFNLVGGFSKGDVNNSLHDTSISSFNFGGIMDYRDENDILKFSLLYGFSSFDTQRNYFVNTFPNDIADYIGDGQSVSKEKRLSSSPTTHQILLDIQYSHEIFVEYLSTFSRWNNVILTPKIFFTPSILIGSSYTEDGEISSMKVGSYTTPIIETGGGLDASKEFNFASNSSVKVSFTTDMFYRYYNIPANSIGFAEAGSTVSLGSEGSYSGLIISPALGVYFNYKSSQFNGFYKREIASNSYQNIFGVSYKYSF
ncbi:MAG: autotransporter outer membrane beta-barrel domain-containing protein [Alphaproteobacteria bacterium]|jgi:hypothetical protein|nr:autotransporter outer membrane beta-barrel domain-containing protein [Alphaproteobacteria bacterium]